MPQLNSDSDTEHVPVTTIKDNNPAVEIRLESDPLKSVNIADISNRREFLTMPIPEGKQLQCTIKREKGSLGLFPQYDVFLSNEYRYLMSAKKRSGNATSNYLITADKNDMETNSTNYLGKVRSNFMGTCFQIYDDGCNPDKVETGKKSRKILSSVHYASNIFGSKGPRKMEVYVPDPAKNPATVPDRDLKEHWEKDPNSFVQLLNKPPKWNELKQIYMLDFKGRVDKPSVKNFILTYKDQEEVCFVIDLAIDPAFWEGWRRRLPPGPDVSTKPCAGSWNRDDIFRHQAGLRVIRDSSGACLRTSFLEFASNRVLSIPRW